jgi:hypothetical protein
VGEDHGSEGFGARSSRLDIILSCLFVLTYLFPYENGERREFVQYSQKRLCNATKCGKSLDKRRGMCYNDINDGGNRRKTKRGKNK